MKIHFIGICGVAMSALALALKKAGYEVTGSDVGIYPPISTYLKESGVDYYTGWHPDRVLRSFSEGGKDGNLVVVGNVASSNNPEWLYVQENKLNYKSYPEVIKEFFVKENSIVCAGTYGKTTSSSILTWILKENNFDPSYMFGGISLNDMPAASLGENLLDKNPSTHANSLRTTYSVVEGDEYKSSRWDNGPKFAHYSPTHLLLTSVVWDHADVYPTEKSYIQAFEKLVSSLPKNGLLVSSEKVDKNIVKLSNCQIVTYGKEKNNDYQYTDVKTSKDGITFNINHKSEIYNLKSDNLGDYMADNMTGCFAMAHELGIEPDKIIKSLSTFKNIKRRLEKRYSNGVTVFDDIAHSPKKAEAVLASLRHIYSDPERSEGEESFEVTHDGVQNSDVAQNTETPKDPSSSSSAKATADSLGIKPKIIAIFEPNGGNRQVESIPGYDNAFASADEVIIPRLTTIKQDPTKPKNLDGQDLANIISKTHRNVKYINDDEKLINHLVKNTNNGDVIIFLGSHGFRGMIDELVSSFRTRR